MKVYFSTHATTFDNEANIASGHKDVALSPLGEKQARELPDHLRDIRFDVVFTSRLKRSIDTARIAFGDSLPIFSDARLDELNLGDLNGAKAEIVQPLRLKHVEAPFPHGESYNMRLVLMKAFLDETRTKYPNKSIVIIGHRATQWSLDVLLAGKTFQEVIPKHFKWQPYWEYSTA